MSFVQSHTRTTKTHKLTTLYHDFDYRQKRRRHAGDKFKLSVLWTAPLSCSLHNKKTKTLKRTTQDVALLIAFHQTKGGTRKEIAEILPAELNEHLSKLILSVRTKKGQEYEPSSLQGMVASFDFANAHNTAGSYLDYVDRILDLIW